MDQNMSKLNDIKSKQKRLQSDAGSQHNDSGDEN